VAAAAEAGVEVENYAVSTVVNHKSLAKFEDSV